MRGPHRNASQHLLRLLTNLLSEPWMTRTSHWTALVHMEVSATEAKSREGSPFEIRTYVLNLENVIIWASLLRCVTVSFSQVPQELNLRPI